MKRNIFTQLATPGAAIDSSYDMAESVFIDVPGISRGSGTLTYKLAELESIYLLLEDIVSATEVDVRLCWDAAGDYSIIPETTAEITLGITDATNGSVAIHGNDYTGAILVPVGNLFLVVKTNTGTATIAVATVTWRGES